MLLRMIGQIKVSGDQFRKSSFRESRAAVADDVYPGTKHIGASVSSLYLLEKMASKINRSNMFWD